MKCHEHDQVDAIATCSTCGRALCRSCERERAERIFCADHVGTMEQPPPLPPLEPTSRPYLKSPGLAFVLGLCPGLGHLYLGLARRGFALALAFLFMLVFANEVSEFFGFLAFFVAAYSAFDAARLANRINREGEPEGSAGELVRASDHQHGVAFGLLLIVVGILLWLDMAFGFDLAWLADQWPLGLVLAGAYLIWSARKGHDTEEG